MTFRTISRFPQLALLLAGSTGALSLSACGSRNSESAAAAAPAPADTARAVERDTAMTARASEPASDSSTSSSTAGASTDSSADAASSSSSSSASPSAAPAPAQADSQWLKYDPATKTVTFRLVAGPFDWNGYTSGGATLTVPPGSTNVINFEQNDGTPHSAEISSGTGPVPNSGGDPAIPRAYTNKVVEGLPQGATDVMRFTAPDTGTFRLICGVPGHALSGMWIWYKVDPAAQAPSFGPTPK